MGSRTDFSAVVPTARSLWTLRRAAPQAVRRTCDVGLVACTGRARGRIDSVGVLGGGGHATGCLGYPAIDSNSVRRLVGIGTGRRVSRSTYTCTHRPRAATVSVSSASAGNSPRS